MKTTNRIGRKVLLWSCAAILGMQLTGTAQTLVNRYSFNDDGSGSNVVDSVGGPAWNGTVPNGGDFVDAPGQLLLSASSQQYVQLPAGILSNYTAVTIDVWATFATLPGACFLYGFGGTDTNILTSGSPSGFNYIFCQPAAGRIAITATDPGYTGEQGTGGAGNFSSQTIHVTSVYNPTAGYVELYTNGVLVSRNSAITVPMSSVSNQLSYIARSLYGADSYMDIELNEFRIWNGALNSLQVAGSDVGGPDTVSTSPGSVTSIQLQIPFFQLVQGGNELATVLAQASSFASPIDITRLATYSSGNTNILTVSTNGLIVAVGQGSANVIATYGSLTSTQLVTVVQPSSTLVHRYSFSDTIGSTTVADSINPGGAWNGTLPNGGTFSGTQLSLLAGSSQYVQLPPGVISNYTAVTIEAWASFPVSLPGNCFFWGFGNTDGSGLGANYIYLQPSSGHIGITGSDPGYTSEQQAGGYGNLSLRSNVHITAVFNPQANWIAVYTNGVLTGKNLAVTWQMNSVSSALNYIARSLYNDPYMTVNMDEFRIYNGALTSQGIAISDAAGPDSISAAATNGPGALLSLSIQAPATMQVLQVGSLKLLANYVSLTNWDIIGNSIFPPAGLTITSSDTNVLVYGTDNLLHAANAGTASIVTVYQGITNSQSIVVTQAAAPTLVHRYSFNEANGSTSVADSVGGSTWNGTVMAGGANAVVAPGNFSVSKLTLASANTNYVQLPGGILSNYTAVTIESWADMTTFPNNSCLWSFGATDPNFLSGGQASGYNLIFCAPQIGDITISDKDPSWYGGQSTSDGANWTGRTNFHLTAVFNPPAGYMAIYTNGVLAAINTGEIIPMSSVSNLLSYIGRSLFNADPYPDLNMDEFRIYNGALSPNDIKATQVIGPNQVLTTTNNVSVSASGSNLVLSWPVSAGSYTLQSTTNLASGVWTTLSSPAAQLVGSQWQVTTPNTGGVKFFRLAR